MHGGSIEARSEGAGKGAEFIIALPAVALAPSGGQGETRHRPPPAIVPQHRILVVDDLRATAEIQAMLLRAIGQDVHVLYDGLSALEWVIANKPDVVFVDIAMPGINGYELARRLRSQAELRELKLVALTGYGQANDRRMAITAGFDHHMTKPASLNAFEELLVRLPVKSSQEDIRSDNPALQAG
jgi:CheY-like chemotaxis protein